jgi:hypothetical protein
LDVKINHRHSITTNFSDEADEKEAWFKIVASLAKESLVLAL